MNSKELYWEAEAMFTIRLTATEMGDILVGCFEGGSNYWIDYGVVFDPTCDVEVDVMKGNHASDYVGMGGSLWIPVKDDQQNLVCRKVDPDLTKKHGYGELPDGHFFLSLNAEALFEGYKKYISHQIGKEKGFPDMDYMDASDHDNILQMALFGELVYG